MHTPNVTNPDLNKLIAANNDFGFRLLSWLAQQEAGKNIFISSFSVAMALTMVYNGAESKTKEALAELLGLSELGLQQINEANATLMSPTGVIDPKVQLIIANSIWLRNGITPSSNFIQQIKDYYSGEVTSLNFEQPSAADIINQWVADKTRNMISKIVKPLDVSMAILILINAIYFKGIWATEFDKAQTVERDFHKLDGSRQPCPMMSQSGSYDYYEADDFQAISLPYGTGRISMYIFLPASTYSIHNFQKSINAKTWGNWLDGFGEAEGEVTIPRLKIEYGQDLLEGLIALGGSEIAGEDFSGIGAGPLQISSVMHKAIVEVNEEGTEAAAVTAVLLARGVSRPSKRFTLIADRPFFMAIRDNVTGGVLFTGIVRDPTQS
jgi:serpin B